MKSLISAVFKSIFSISLILYGIYLVINSVGIFVGDSNHMGSRVRLAGETLSYQVDKLGDATTPEMKVYLQDNVDAIISEGRLGFDLLWGTLRNQLISGILLVICGLVFFPSTRVEMPNKGKKSERF